MKTLAQDIADDFDRVALEQIAAHCRRAEAVSYALEDGELEKFKALEAAINDVLGLQSEDA